MENSLQLLQQIDEENRDSIQKQLQQHIAYLIHHDFEKLVRLLYTVDVDEKRLKSFLQQNEKRDAAETIAALLIERQLQKRLARQQAKRGGLSDDAEKW